MNRTLALLVMVPCFLPLPARAATSAYGIRLPPDGLVVEVPYTTGTHHEHVTEVQGDLRIDPEGLRLSGGRLVIPLSSFRDDNAERACHLREALGLDYARSRYPRDHVCNDQHRLPASGPDAIAYPQIVVDLTRGGPAATGSGASSRVEVDGTLTAHGVSRPIHLELTVSHDAAPGMIRVRGRLPIRLSEFGITVKSAQVLFVSISVRDEVTIDVNALLEPLRQG